jgi:hypothetical protein
MLYALFTIHQGKRYRAAISLNWVERLASNEIVAQMRSRFFGCPSIRARRYAQSRALWPAQDVSAEIPPQIKSIEEVEA